LEVPTVSLGAWEPKVFISLTKSRCAIDQKVCSGQSLTHFFGLWALGDLVVPMGTEGWRK